VTETSAGGMPYASFILETMANVEWTNVRQVAARGFAKRERLEQLRRERKRLQKELHDQLPAEADAEATTQSEIRSARKLSEPIEPPKTDPAIQERNPYIPWYYFDPTIRPRFNRILNPLAFALRTPFSAHAVREKMQDGEVISWALNGRVEVGAEVGWSIIRDPALVKAGVSYRLTAVGEGEFRLAVLREDRRFVKVKLSNHERHGTHQRISVSGEKKKFFGGFMVFKGTALEKSEFLAQDVKIQVLEWDRTALRGKLFDVGYRYDLDSEDGKEAYHRAVLGNFTPSETYAARDLKSENPAVQRVFHRVGDTDTRVDSKQGQLWFFLKRGREKKLDSLEAKITLPDGTHSIFRSVAEKGDRNQFGLGMSREKTTYKVSVLLDRELYEKNDPASLFVIGEAFYEDGSTHGKEIYRQVKEIENFTGNTKLFPDLAYTSPRARTPEYRTMKRTWFGRSSFYWGFHFTRGDVERFLETPVEDRARWVHTFIPEHRRIAVLRHWEEASAGNRTRDPKAIFAGLKELFSDRSIGRQLMYLLRASLAERPMDYFVTAQNPAFGRVQERARAQTSVDQITLLTERTMGFEGYARRQAEDFEARVSEIGWEMTPEGLIRIQFELDHDPKTLFFRIARTKDVFGAKDIVELNYANRSAGNPQRFHKGLNTLLLDPRGDDLAHRLSIALRRDRAYLFQVAYSRGTKNFGSLAGTTFQGTEGYPRVRQDPDHVSKH
jgi:hypothetical protein